MIEIKQELLTEQLKKQIHEGFARHSIAVMGHNEKFEPMAFIATEDGQFIGAVVGEVFWGALHIKLVYIEDDYRNQGLATRLMEQAFNYAKEQKCPFAFVETMSFQALDFYKKLGFELEFTRSGYSHRTSFHYLKKVIKH